MASKQNIAPTGKYAAQRLDFAIKYKEVGDTETKKFYELDNRQYYNYIDKETWQSFIEEMKITYPKAYQAYCEGSGNELKEYNTKYGRRPPKMASYGSSSRMIYLLSREKEKNGFCFEKQLPTTVSGTANLDGYLYCAGTHYYIEAKCREPYSSKSHIVKCEYKDLYQYFTDDENLALSCETTPYKDEKTKEMKVDFFVQGKKIRRFDIKQMISHLLGIATELLKNPSNDKIHFIYLIYNPSELKERFDNPKHFENICKTYGGEEGIKTECETCRKVLFKPLFRAILLYLHNKKGVGTATNGDIERMAKNFTFKLYDQQSYTNLLNGILSK